MKTSSRILMSSATACCWSGFTIAQFAMGNYGIMGLGCVLVAVYLFQCWDLAKGE